ncbi:MAG TPA: archaeosortase A [Methanomicrobia archaeon]|nr:archaeosortase A [Methanomicrobia archaeon]HEX59330.1 archaeosortase A [Methanomicrobia archaeon]
MSGTPPTAAMTALAKPVLGFSAIGLLLIAFRRESGRAALSGWLLLASYWFIELLGYLRTGEPFDAAVALTVLLFCVLLAGHAAAVTAAAADAAADNDSSRERRRFMVLMARVGFICGVCYLPFSEIKPLGELLIYATAALTAAAINFLHGVGLLHLSVRAEFPAFIHAENATALPPVEIILACTAIQSIVIFTGIIFGVEAPLDRKMKAFIVSVPVIFVLNVFRNVFVTAAYFEAWFGGDNFESFYIAHHVIARVFVLGSLVVIAYAVFVTLPETIDLVEKLLALLLGGIKPALSRISGTGGARRRR